MELPSRLPEIAASILALPAELRSRAHAVLERRRTHGRAYHRALTAYLKAVAGGAETLEAWVTAQEVQP